MCTNNKLSVTINLKIKEKHKGGFYYMNIDEAIEECDRLSRACNVMFPLDQQYEQVANWLTQLKEYQQLEADGRLVKLPCKVNDDMYSVPDETLYRLNILSGLSKNNKVYHQKVSTIIFIGNTWYVMDREYGTRNIFAKNEFKETWFLTKEEAELRLAELRGNNE